MAIPCKQWGAINMKGRKTWERGYAAGLIDGEGCIQIKKVSSRPGRSTEYSLQININMVDKGPLDFMLGAFGGKLYFIETKSIDRQSVWRWELSRKPALPFLKQILMFLRCKQEQAQLAIRFQCMRMHYEQHSGRWQRIPQHILEQFEQFYVDMKNLKSPCAAVTTKQDDPHVEGSDSLNLQERIYEL